MDTVGYKKLSSKLTPRRPDNDKMKGSLKTVEANPQPRSNAKRQKHESMIRSVAWKETKDTGVREQNKTTPEKHVELLPSQNTLVLS